MTENDTKDTSNLGGGNTSSPPKVLNRSRRFSFTINNYEEKEIELLMTLFSNDLYIMGREVGKKGTPHIQGYVEFKNARSYDSLKKIMPTAHIEKARGNRKKNFIYCSKDGNFETNITGIIIPKKIRDPLEGKELKPFQQEIIDLIKEEPDDRTIHWYWEKDGCKGKTALCKHICIHNNCLILNGKQNDMFDAILRWKEQKGDFPDTIVIDIPRSNIDYVSWGAIEKIKDGLFYSGKYEGGMVIMNSPHVICMANSMPELSKLSLDRWNIKHIDGP